MFDGVHLGHRHLWKQIGLMCADCGASSLAVTFRNHPLELIAPQKAPLSLGPVDQRASLLRQAGADNVLILDFTPELRMLSAAEFVNLLADKYAVTHMVVGFNNSIGSDRVSTPEAYALLAQQTHVHIYPAEEFRIEGMERISSSTIRNALAAGHIDTANSMLGRNYSISGVVSHGQQLGRTIGFPTANIVPDDSRQALPAPGVYALDAILPDGTSRRAMANIGKRPTVESSTDAPITFEVNIFDFEGDLYGKNLNVHFLKRLRDEQRFDSLEALRNRLEEDRHQAISL